MPVVDVHVGGPGLDQVDVRRHLPLGHDDVAGAEAPALEPGKELRQLVRGDAVEEREPRGGGGRLAVHRGS